MHFGVCCVNPDSKPKEKLGGCVAARSRAHEKPSIPLLK
jgi:hypothetical protein